MGEDQEPWSSVYSSPANTHLNTLSLKNVKSWIDETDHFDILIYVLDIFKPFLAFFHVSLVSLRYIVTAEAAH